MAQGYALLIGLLLLVNPWQASGQTQAADALPACAAAKQQLRQLPARWPAGKTAGKGVGAAYDLHYMRARWRVDPAVQAIRGAIQFRFTVQAVDSATALRFDMSPSLQVDSILYHGDTLAYQHEAQVLKVLLPSGLSQGALDSLTIHYHGTPQRKALGTFAADSINGRPILWTLSEPYGAREWWPTKQSLTDKIDSLDIYLTVPAQYETASNGLLVATRTLEDSALKRYHWRHRYPIPAYLVAIAVTEYAELRDTLPTQAPGDVLWQEFVYPEDSAWAEAAIGKLKALFPALEEKLGAYPFAQEKYGHAQFSRGGGMEHQTMTFVVGFGYRLLVHELAHQWFGNLITCGSWQDIWLNEAFGTWTPLLAYQLRPDLVEANKLQRVLKDYQGIMTQKPGGSVYVYDTTSVGRVFSARLTYIKSSLVLRQLRHRLGDEAFFAGIRSYLHDPQLRYGYARTPDLRRHFEAACHCSLQQYFQRWIYGEGYPSYTVSWQRPARDSLALTIRQHQSLDSIAPFEQAFPLRIWGHSPKGQAADTTLRFNYTGEQLRRAFPWPYRVDSMRLDPERWLVRGATQYRFEQPADQELYLAPNPAQERVRLLYNGQTALSAPRITLIDSRGQRVRRYQPGPLAGTQAEVALDITDLNAGVYLLRLTDEASGTALEQKLMITR
jgi:hypothetical protein